MVAEDPQIGGRGDGRLREVRYRVLVGKSCGGILRGEQLRELVVVEAY